MENLYIKYVCDIYAVSVIGNFKWNEWLRKFVEMVEYGFWMKWKLIFWMDG